MRAATVRIARPTDDIEALLPFYIDGLGFERLGGFEDHDGFHGVMLGHAGRSYHLEFTKKVGHRAGKAPTEDNLLVFYLPEEAAFEAATARMAAAGISPVTSFNPYWDRIGLTYEDADGYRVVLANADWPSVKP